MSDDIQGRFVSSLYQHIQRFCREYRSGARNNCTFLFIKESNYSSPGGSSFFGRAGRVRFRARAASHMWASWALGDFEFSVSLKGYSQ